MSGARSSAGTRHRSVSSRALLETAEWSTGSLLSPSHPPTGLQSRLLAWQNMPVPSPGEWRDDDAAVCSGDQGLICKIVLKPTSVGDALTTRRCYVGEAEDPARSCRLLHACTPGPNRIGSFLDNFHCPCLNFVEIVETAAFPYEKHTLTSSNVLSIQFFIYLLYIF